MRVSRIGLSSVFLRRDSLQLLTERPPPVPGYAWKEPKRHQSFPVTTRDFAPLDGTRPQWRRRSAAGVRRRHWGPGSVTGTKSRVTGKSMERRSWWRKRRLGFDARRRTGEVVDQQLQESLRKNTGEARIDHRDVQAGRGRWVITILVL